jgi:hypothetical protein
MMCIFRGNQIVVDVQNHELCGRLQPLDSINRIHVVSKIMWYTPDFAIELGNQDDNKLALRVYPVISHQ